jgi:hypothetical protein
VPHFLAVFFLKSQGHFPLLLSFTRIYPYLRSFTSFYPFLLTILSNVLLFFGVSAKTMDEF